VVKGDAFLAAQWADIPDKKPILRSLFASNSDSWQAYEGWTGTITTLRRSPKLPFGPNPIPVPISRCPLVLEPIECLGYEDGEASSFLALDWVQLRRPGFLEQRMAALHATVSTAADGGWDVVVPTNDFLEQAGSEPKVVHFGRTETYHVRPYPEHGGLRLVERITYARKGEPPAGSRTFTYRAFPGVPGEPLLVLAVSKAGSGDQPEQLTSISVGAPVASDEVQIDPTMAKRILDLETGMTIQP
jgi:hypothetical protein